MPAAPEFLDRKCHVRMIKVFRQLNAEKTGYPLADRDAAEEIRIQLETVQDGRQPEIGPAVLGGMIKHPAGKDTGFIRNHQFQEEPVEDQLQASEELFFTEPVPFIKLRAQLLMPGYGPLDDLREKRDEQRVFQNVMFRLRIAPVNIDQIGHDLQGIKGKTNRNDQAESDRNKTGQLHQQ